MLSPRALALMLLALPGCPTGDPGVDPVLTITSPAEGAEVPLPDDAMGSIPIEFTVTDFALAAPGTCAGVAACGHIYLSIDGTDCDAAPDAYNNVGTNSPIDAMLALCPSPAGAHDVTLSLRSDDGAAFLDSTGAEVSASLSLTVAGPLEPAEPATLVITTPTDGAHVFPGPDPGMSVVVVVEVTNFTLMAPGGCSGPSAACGQVVVSVDGDDCDGGEGWNNLGGTETTAALLSLCANALGEHTISVELRSEGGSAVLDAAGEPVRDEVTVTVDEPPHPTITIDSPIMLAVVAPGSSSPFALPVEFSVVDFTLAEPGTCEPGIPGCGHVHLAIDGADCNETDRSANTLAWASPADLLLGLCPLVFGSHTITASLRQDDGLPIPDAEATVSIEVTTGEPAILVRSPTVGETVTMASNHISVAFEVENWTMGDYQTCAVDDDACGQVRVSVSGPGCTAGNPFSVQGTTSPLDVNLGTCSSPTGLHTLTTWLFPANGASLGTWSSQTFDITTQ